MFMKESLLGTWGKTESNWQDCIPVLKDLLLSVFGVNGFPISHIFCEDRDPDNTKIFQSSVDIFVACSPINVPS